MIRRVRRLSGRVRTHARRVYRSSVTIACADGPAYAATERGWPMGVRPAPVGGRTMATTVRPRVDDEVFLLAEVAQLYYADDLTQDQIAQQLSVSRSAVSRMLKEARERGLVEIRVHHPLQTSPELERELVGRFELTDAVVLRSAPSGFDHDAAGDAAEETAHKVGALGARYLQRHLEPQAILAVGWGSAVLAVVSSGYLRRMPGVSIVQAMGSTGNTSPDLDGIQIVARLARISGGQPYFLHAPMVVADAAVRTGLLRDQHLRKTLEMVRRASVFVFSVGVIGDRSGLYRSGYLTETDLEVLRGQGIVGEIAGIYFDLDGQVRQLEINERMIAAPAEVIQTIPTRVGVSFGEVKAVANLGAIRSGLLNVLITDEPTARSMLRHA